MTLNEFLKEMVKPENLTDETREMAGGMCKELLDLSQLIDRFRLMYGYNIELDFQENVPTSNWFPKRVVDHLSSE